MAASMNKSKTALRMPSLRKYSCIERQRMRRIGVRFFNEDPFSGLLYLQTNSIMKQDAETVASWLLNQEGLSRSAIGDFLGSPSSFTLEVLEHYVSMQKLYEHPFVQAMRRFMSNFRIPGEAQKIERILEVFARHFTTRYPTDEDGSGVDECGEPRTTVQPSSTDTAHILSYSIIMLNTDLHNTNVKHHMSREEFVRNNRGIDHGKDLPADLLDAIYSEVASEQFKAKEDPLDELVELEKKIRHLDLDKRLVAPQRRLIMKIPACLVTDWRKGQQTREHARTLFLFNDMLLVTKKAWGSSSEFVFKSQFQLRSANFEAYTSELYPLGVEVHSRFRRDSLLRVALDCRATHRQFVRQAREMVSEAIVIERLPPSDTGKSKLAAEPSGSNLATSTSVSNCHAIAIPTASSFCTPDPSELLLSAATADTSVPAVSSIAEESGGSSCSSRGSGRSSKRLSEGDLASSPQHVALCAASSGDFLRDRRGGLQPGAVLSVTGVGGKYKEISEDTPVVQSHPMQAFSAKGRNRAVPQRRPAFRAKMALTAERDFSDDAFISTDFRVRTLSLENN